jgi:hypothetical protein
MYLLDQNLVNDHISCENADFLDDYPLRSKRIQQPIQSEIHNILANPTDRQKKGDAEYSVIDLSSVSFKNFEEMKTFFAIHFQIFFIKKNVFEKLNSIYVESVTLYENRYLREVPRDVKNTKFSSINDVSNFLKTT